MANNNLKNKYFFKVAQANPWTDFTTYFTGLKILSVEGFNERGEPVNVYSEQWVNSPTEDFMVASDDDCSVNRVIHKNIDLKMTFICGERYGASDTQTVHDNFISLMCDNGDLYIRSAYTGKIAHVACLQPYKPTVEKLHRGNNSYIMGTLTLHCLEPTYNV